MTKKAIYMDHAAATPMDQKVLTAMQPYFTEKFYNPSALYLAAKSVSKDISMARASIAGHLGTRPAEIIFTAGGTEANNLAVQGIMKNYPDGNIVVSAVEHESVLAPARKFNCKEAPVQPDGQIDLRALEKLIDDNTVLVSVMYTNNEIGTLQPIRQISNTLSELRKRRKNSGNDMPLYLHTDACQAAAYLDLHVSRLGVDLMTINGGKIYGPKQSGALYIRAGVKLEPQMLGGGQEFGVRSGTENVAGIIGLAAALDLVQSRRGEEVERLQKLQRIFIELLEEKLPDAQVNGSRKHRLPNNVHITLPGQDNERLIFALDEAGIQAAAGSACSAGNDEPSHVLCAIGKSDEYAQASLRFTMGFATTEADVRRAVDTLVLLVI
jgi:cysteine desulfurase